MTKIDQGAFERKSDDDTTDDIVTKALGDLTKTMETRLADIEKKADTTKLAERLDKIETKVNRPGTGDPDQKTEPGVETKAFAAYLRGGINTPADEVKALTASSDPGGGYLAPAEMSTEFVRELVEVSPIRAVASVRSTGAPSVVYPKRTGITNALWKGETQAAGASEPAFGQVEVVVKQINTYVDISNELLADSAGQAEAEVRTALAEDFGQKEGVAFINGNGVLEPEGILTNAAITPALNGHAANLSPDAIITMVYSLPAMYRARGAFAMNGKTLGVIRKLKDGDGRLLWQPSYASGQPETLLGYPVVEMVDMPDAEADAFPIIFGDWSGYRIVDRVGLSILSNPYLLATNGMTRIHATRRVGGGVIQASKFRKFKMATS